MRSSFRTIALVVLASAGIAVPLARSAGGAADGLLPPEKIAMLEQIRRARDEALAAPHAAKELASADVPDVPEPAWLTGIIEDGQAPLPGSAYVILNQWHDVVAGEHTNVYAGAERERPEAGLVVVDTTALDLSAASTPGGVYATPVAAGAVRIVEAAGTKLVLLSATGARFVFDVVTRTYL